MGTNLTYSITMLNREIMNINVKILDINGQQYKFSVTIHLKLYYQFQ